MNLSPGTRLGPYEIAASIGAGGMGEVYRARDTVLGRDVALKVLPEAFVRDPDRLARFEREAQVLAALNHPNIATIFGVEQSGTARALVMEFVPGRTIEELIASGPVPVADAIAVAQQIAKALEAAHDAGIIHRDLKPANVKVTDDGTVKVLDFGLAKATDPAASGAGDAAAMNSPTLTARATQMGMIIGTAAYMAPEQARGRPVDRRADIWSFGVVLVEMLTGQRAFQGEDISAVLAKVIERDPDLSILPLTTPPSVRRLIGRCLLKDPKQRLRDIGEARVALDEAREEVAQPPLPPPAASHGKSAAATSRWTRVVPWGLTTALALTVAALLLSPPAAAPVDTGAVRRLQIALPPGLELYTAVGSAISLSPDGSTLAFVGVGAGVRQVYLRPLDRYDVTPVRGTQTAVSAVFSADGKELLIGLSDTSLRRLRLADGLIETVTPSTSEYLGGWLNNGRAVFSRDGRLWMTGALPGEAPTQLTEAPAGGNVVESSPTSVPGVNALLFVSGPPGASEGLKIEALSLDTRARTLVVERASAPLVTTTGHLLFVRDDALLVAPFDTRSLTITGEARPVLRDMVVVRNRGVSPILSISTTGVLAYASGAVNDSDLVTVSRTGTEQTLLHIDRPAANPRISPDGTRMLIEETGGGLWVYDLERRTLGRLTDGQTIAAFPLFTRDGRTAVYRDATGMFRLPVDGSGKPSRIEGSGASEFPTGLSPDGGTLFYTKLGATTAGDLYEVPLAGGAPKVQLSTSAYEGGGQVSPDGKWILYVSNELGGSEVFVQPYPSMDRRIQVSSDGGIHPMWHPSGREIFYRSAEKMMAVGFSAPGGQAMLSRPVMLFSGRYAFGGGLTIPNYALMPDGERFVFVKERSGVSVNLVLNWFSELQSAR